MTLHPELEDGSGVVVTHRRLLRIVADTHTNMGATPTTPDVVRQLKPEEWRGGRGGRSGVGGERREREGSNLRSGERGRWGGVGGRREREDERWWRREGEEDREGKGGKRRGRKMGKRGQRVCHSSLVSGNTSF